MWNYNDTGGHGSPEMSVLTAGKTSHDRLEVKSTKLSTDGKKLFVEIADLHPCDQLRIKLNVNGTDVVDVSQKFYQTIYKMRPARH